MRFLAAKCPKTGKFFSTGIETDPDSMIKLPRDIPIAISLTTHASAPGQARR
jgi:hypothetical protein